MTSNRNTSRMLTTRDVSRLLNVHINTVRRWSNEGLLRAYRIGTRGDRRFKREDIALFLSSRDTYTGHYQKAVSAQR